MKICQDIWKCEVVSSDFMLGIRRRLTHDSEGVAEYCDLDMIPFVEGMAETFRDHLPKPYGGKLKSQKEQQKVEKKFSNFDPIDVTFPAWYTRKLDGFEHGPPAPVCTTNSHPNPICS